MREPSDRHYSMIFEGDPRDAIFVVTVPELPGRVTHGATYEQAVRQGEDAIGSWLDVALARGRQAPSPRYVQFDPAPATSRASGAGKAHEV